MNESIVETVRSMTNKEMVIAIVALQKEVEELKARSTQTSSNEPVREMTEDDALRILNGDLKDKKHKEAANTLNLSYGQVYSCRLEFTFKNVHKKLKEQGFKNPWSK